MMLKNTLDSSRIKILVCCHKKCEIPDNDVFFPIQVGASISDIDLGMQRDDLVSSQACDNISSKNKSYCELTAVYWAWKNIKKLYPNLDYIGLNHYRRYFCFDKFNAFEDVIVKKLSELKDYKLDLPKMSKLLLDKKIIVAKERIYPFPLFVDYCICHISSDIKLLRKIVHDLYPEYDEAFYTVIMRGNMLSHYNMFVMDWKSFDSYCNWLFSILAEADRLIDIQNYSVSQKRIFGYMAERLLNVWLFKNDFKLKKFNVYKYDDAVVPVKNSLARKIFYRIRFFISSLAYRPFRKKIPNWDWLKEC